MKKAKLPTSASLAITFRCNSRCVMCDIWKRKEKGGLLPKIYKKLPKSLEDIDITGGEPFLRNDLPKIVGVLRKACPQAKILIITNGFLPQKIARALPSLLKQDKNLAFRVSLDGWGETHNKIRGVTNGFKKTRETLDILRKPGVKDLGIIFTLMEINSNEVGKILSFCKKQNLQFSLNLVHDSLVYFGEKKTALRPKLEVIEESLEKVKRFFLPSFNPKNWAKAWFYEGLSSYTKTGERPLKCGAGEDFFYLDPFGNVYLCQFKRFKIGNLKKQSFSGIWQGKERKEFLKKVRNCHGCFMICTAKDEIRKNKFFVLKSYLKKTVLLLSPFFLSLGAVLAAFLSIELAFRLFFPTTSFQPDWVTRSVSGGTVFQLDDELIYSMKPNSYRIWETDEFIEKIKTNSLGLRDEEIPLKKEKFRIFALGDSFTFGHGVAAEQSYPNQLEKLIKDYSIEGAEVINAGVKGYDLDQEYRFFTTRLRELELDLLVVTLGKEDYSSSCERPLYDLIDDKLVSLDARKTWLYLQIFLYTRSPSWLKQSHLFAYLLQALNGRNFFKISLQGRGGSWREQCEDWSYEKALKQLVELRKIGNQKGFRLLVVFYPAGEVTKFKELLKVNNFLIVDVNQKDPLLAEIDAPRVLGTKEINWEELRFKSDAHLTPEGNKIFAQIVLEGIIREGLLKIGM